MLHPAICTAGIALLVVAMLLTGCDTNTPDPEGLDERADAESAAFEAGPSRLKTDERPEFDTPPSLDLLMFYFAEEVPGFGGFFFDEEGQFTTYLLPEEDLKDRGYEVVSDKERLERLRVLIGLYFEEDFYARGSDERMGTRGSDAIRIMPARYDARELLNWRWQIRELASEGIVSIDFNEAQNQIVLGVQDNGGGAQALVEKLGIPEDAVALVEEKPTVPDLTVRNSVRGLQGGTQLTFDTNPNTPGVSACTLGFPARLNSVLGFVTNAHCSQQLGSTATQTTYRQAWGEDVGEEQVDPATFQRETETYTIQSCTFFGLICSTSTGTKVHNTNCPTGANCRYSDALFARRLNDTDTEFGRIARVTGVGTTGTGNAGSLEIDDDNPTYRIVGTAQYAVSGQILDKIGRTTGHTYGKVRRTDYDVWQAGSNNFMVDQQGIGCFSSSHTTGCIRSGGGDSGSPVFDWSYSGDITLYGIHWGGNGSSRTTFSPLGGLDRDDLDVEVH